MLTDEQSAVLTSVLEGQNIFLTGDAGTGKSFLIGAIVKCKKFTAVTAMTGSAALLINGSTLHSFLGIGLAKEPAEKLAKSVRKFTPVVTRILETKTLIVDEVSMMSDELFEKVDAFLKILKRSSRPFGGIQMVLVGDPFQLCPVEGSYFFTSKLWEESGFTRKNLTVNMRQKGDPLFKEILDTVRFGGCPEKYVEILARLKDTKFPEGIKPTRLYSKNVSVDGINQSELAELVGSGAEFKEYPVNYTSDRGRRWVQANKIPEKVSLCVGAQVMCTRNQPTLGLANGSRGVITKADEFGVWFKKLDGFTVFVPYFVAPIDARGGDETVSYMPVKLAWAITIHSAQGMTIDALEVDLGQDIFTWGQAYTGLSRATSLESVRVANILSSSFVTHPIVLDKFSS